MDKIAANEGVISTAASRVAVCVIQWAGRCATTGISDELKAGWMSGWMGGRMWIWTVMGVLVAVCWTWRIRYSPTTVSRRTSARASGRRSTRQNANASWP